MSASTKVRTSKISWNEIVEQCRAGDKHPHNQLIYEFSGGRRFYAQSENPYAEYSGVSQTGFTYTFPMILA